MKAKSFMLVLAVLSAGIVLSASDDIWRVRGGAGSSAAYPADYIGRFILAELRPTTINYLSAMCTFTGGRIILDTTAFRPAFSNIFAYSTEL